MSPYNYFIILKVSSVEILSSSKIVYKIFSKFSTVSVSLIILYHFAAEFKIQVMLELVPLFYVFFLIIFLAKVLTFLTCVLWSKIIVFLSLQSSLECNYSNQVFLFMVHYGGIWAVSKGFTMEEFGAMASIPSVGG